MKEFKEPTAETLRTLTIHSGAEPQPKNLSEKGKEPQKTKKRKCAWTSRWRASGAAAGRERLARREDRWMGSKCESGDESPHSKEAAKIKMLLEKQEIADLLRREGDFFTPSLPFRGPLLTLSPAGYAVAMGIK